MPGKTKKAPFKFEAIRPFVSATLHLIDSGKPQPKSTIVAVKESGRVAEEIAACFDSFFDSFDIEKENPYSISTKPEDRGVVQAAIHEELALTGIWFKRITAPPWMDAKLGPEDVRDSENHIVFAAIRCPFMAVLGTYENARLLLSNSLAQGFCGNEQLGFVAPVISQDALERAFVRGKTRVSWLAGLHASLATKPDSKTLVGPDLRKALDPFSDQTFTFTAAVSVLPELQVKRKPRYVFGDSRTTEERARYAFRVGVAPEERKVWTVPTKEFGHMVEELHVLFDTLSVSENTTIIGEEWSYQQEGFKFLSQPISDMKKLERVRHAFDIGLDLPPPPDPGSEVAVSSDRVQSRELWRAYGSIELLEADEESAAFRARVLFNSEPILEFEAEPRGAPDGGVELHWIGSALLKPYHVGTTCFDTLYESGEGTLTVRYDSGHVIRGSRLFLLGWQDVLFESWKWLFDPLSSGKRFYACIEKPVAGHSGNAQVPSRKTARGWEAKLGTAIGAHGSLFEFLVSNAESLFGPTGEWHLCCDDGPGEVADFVYFEPAAGRLYLIHVKGAATTIEQEDSELVNGTKPRRDISVKAYEEVIGQATKNLRYLDVLNLRELLEKGNGLPIGKACFYARADKPYGSRDKILEALQTHGTKHLPKRKVIVFQPHVRESVWKAAQEMWKQGTEPNPKNQVNRFLQLRTLLADAEITCRKVGAEFEAWGQKG